MCMADLHRQPANGDHSPAGAWFPVADVPVRRVFRRHPVFPETEMAAGLDTGMYYRLRTNCDFPGGAP